MRTHITRDGCQVFPLAWCGIIFSFGSKFRKPVQYNKAVWIVWIVLVTIVPTQRKQCELLLLLLQLLLVQ
jgi:hypothetical protein